MITLQWFDARGVAHYGRPEGYDSLRCVRLHEYSTGQLWYERQTDVFLSWDAPYVA